MRGRLLIGGGTVLKAASAVDESEVEAVVVGAGVVVVVDNMVVVVDDTTVVEAANLLTVAKVVDVLTGRFGLQLTDVALTVDAELLDDAGVLLYAARIAIESSNSEPFDNMAAPWTAPQTKARILRACIVDAARIFWVLLM